MKMAYKEEGKWWVSPANYLPEVTKNYHFPEHIEILDTTLRDGEQEPGIIFTKEDKVAIAKRLDAAGVHRIEAGCPMTSEEDAAAIKEICALGLKAKIYCLQRRAASTALSSRFLAASRCCRAACAGAWKRPSRPLPKQPGMRMSSV